MANSYICGQTLDDIMRFAIEEIQSNGEWITPSKGRCKELMGVILEITNPRARLSRSETRGKLFSCLGALCWYLAGTNKLEFISYYIPEYKNYADGDEVFGGYGPRFFAWKGLNQVVNVTNLLRRKAESRKAIIQLFDATDIIEDHGDIPCTCAMQFMIRLNSLHMITYMRSNDVFWGLPHDIFTFTMLQEIMARSLGVELGTYKHIVGSLHIYEKNTNLVQQFLNEGWQSTEMSMPTMPVGDPWSAIHSFLDAETIIRSGNLFDDSMLESLDVYWADLVRLLQVFNYSKYNDNDNIQKIKQKMASPTYRPFIDKKLGENQRNRKRIYPIQ